MLKESSCCPYLCVCQMHALWQNEIIVHKYINTIPYACTILTVYRPGSTSAQLAFFDELSELLDSVITRSEPVYVVGDFNVRLERDDDVNAVRLVDLFSAYGLVVRVTVPTHQLGGMLDVVAIRDVTYHRLMST